MIQTSFISPTPNYQRLEDRNRIRSREGFKARNLHTRVLAGNGMLSAIEVEYCPVCLSRKIGEKMQNNIPVWVCKECEFEW